MPQLNAAFKKVSNATFNNVLFMPPTIRGMHETATRLYEAAEKLKGAAGLSAVAKLLNESPQTVKNWEGRGVSSKGAVKAQDVIGCSAVWLQTGMGPMVDGNAPSEPQPINLDAHPDLVSIRRVRLRLQAGVDGFSIDADETDGTPLFFRAEWLRLRGYKPYHLVAIKVMGQSMEPTLYPDDMVVINTADIEPKDGKVYAVNYEGEAVIKRMVRDNGSWWLSSDNPDQRRFPRKECAKGACIVVGQVIHRQSEQI